MKKLMQQKLANITKKTEKHEHIKKFIDLFSEHFLQMKEALAEKGFEVEISKSEVLNSRLLKVLNSKDLGIVYHLNPERDALAVLFNQGKTERSNMIYFPTSYEYKRLERPRGHGGVANVDEEAKTHHRTLLELKRDLRDYLNSSAVEIIQLLNYFYR